MRRALKDMVVVITGASAGIGKALAEACTRAAPACASPPGGSTGSKR